MLQHGTVIYPRYLPTRRVCHPHRAAATKYSSKLPVVSQYQALTTSLEYSTAYMEFLGMGDFVVTPLDRNHVKGRDGERTVQNAPTRRTAAASLGRA